VIVNMQKLETDIPADDLREGRLDLVICFGPNFHRAIKTSRPDAAGGRPGLRLRQTLGPGNRRSACKPSPNGAMCSHAVDVRHQHGRRLAGTPGPQAPSVARANSYSAALKMITGTDFIITLPRRVQTAGAGSAVRLLRGAQRVAGVHSRYAVE
jgi:DNA-binding transcriptional LysR family regulator